MHDAEKSRKQRIAEWNRTDTNRGWFYPISVTRVMMGGLLGFALIAMLEAQAEAHYIVVGGRMKWHSLHCIVDLTGVPNTANEPAASRCYTPEPENIFARLEVICLDLLSPVLGLLPPIEIIVGEGFFSGYKYLTGSGGSATANIVLATNAELGVVSTICGLFGLLDRVNLKELYIPITIDTYGECVGGGSNPCGCNDTGCSLGTKASTLELDCELPLGESEIVCQEISSTHLD